MEKKLHKILKSKEPSLSKMLKMAENLRTKFGDYVNIKMEAWAYSSGTNEAKFWIGMGQLDKSEEFETWSDLLDGYYKLMEEINYG